MLAEFIKLADEQFAILNKGERAKLNSDPSMTEQEQKDFEKKMSLSDEEKDRLMFIVERKAELQTVLTACPCGSRLRFYRCCGR